MAERTDTTLVLSQRRRPSEAQSLSSFASVSDPSSSRSAYILCRRRWNITVWYRPYCYKRQVFSFAFTFAVLHSNSWRLSSWILGNTIITSFRLRTIYISRLFKRPMTTTPSIKPLLPYSLSSGGKDSEIPPGHGGKQYCLLQKFKPYYTCYRQRRVIALIEELRSQLWCSIVWKSRPVGRSPCHLKTNILINFIQRTTSNLYVI